MELNKYSPEVVTAVCKIDDIKKQAEETVIEAKELIAASEKTIKICDKINSICTENDVDFEEFSYENRKLDKAIYKMKDVVFNLYKIVFSVLTWSEQRLFCEAIIEDYLEPNKQIEGIFARVFKDNLLVHLPILGAKQCRWKTINGAAFPIGSYSFFSNSLEAALRLIDNDIPLYCKKNILYMFVYHSSRMFVIDSDNHDTKVMTDIICSHTEGGDTAKNCSFFFISICDDNLPEGTYITVSEGFGKVPDLQDNLSIWRGLF